jgi:hypothetical protein
LLCALSIKAFISTHLSCEEHVTLAPRLKVR